MTATLLLRSTWQVFTSASTAIFSTFPCDTVAVEGERFLEADYSLSCNTPKHSIYVGYASLMGLVSDDGP